MGVSKPSGKLVRKVAVAHSKAGYGLAPPGENGPQIAFNASNAI